MMKPWQPGTAEWPASSTAMVNRRPLTRGVIFHPLAADLTLAKDQATLQRRLLITMER